MTRRVITIRSGRKISKEKSLIEVYIGKIIYNHTREMIRIDHNRK